MRTTTFAGVALAAMLTMGIQAHMQAQTAGQDMKDAGHDTSHATKQVAHKTAHGTKKVYHKTTHGTSVAAHDTAHATKSGYHKTVHGTERLGDKIAGKPAPPTGQY